MRKSKALPTLMAVAMLMLAGSSPAAADQTVTQSTTTIEEPAGIRVTDDVAMSLFLSRSSITFVNGGASGTSWLGLAGFVAPDTTDQAWLGLQGSGDYSLSGTTLDQDVISVSALSISGSGIGGQAERWRVVLAQYN